MAQTGNISESPLPSELRRDDMGVMKQLRDKSKRDAREQVRRLLQQLGANNKEEGRSIIFRLIQRLHKL